MTNAIEFNGVWKKFKKGEKFDSLRDLIPNLVKGAFGLNGKKQLELAEQEFWAVKDVSFQLKRGEALGIIGPNGAGKSTILKLLTRILRPTQGEIKINGKLSALLEVGAGFHGDLTGRENIYLSGTIIGMKKKEIEKRIDSIIAFSELEEFIDTPVKRYSSGMYVRLGFSISAHTDPEILLLDEVLAVGDVSFQLKCLQKVQEIREKGMTIIFISHNLESIKRLCPDSIFLHKGEVQYKGKSQQAIEHYLRTVNERFNVNINSDSKKESSAVSIAGIKLYDLSNVEKKEFKTGEYLRIEITYNASKKVIQPTFTVGFFSNDRLFADHNSRFEGNDIPFVEGVGKVNLIIEKLLLLPGHYEARAHIADKDSLGIFDVRGTHFFVQEKKRGYGLYYQPHNWNY